MSSRPGISDLARRDLDKQYRWYLKHASVATADGFYSAFHSAFERLLERPKIGWNRLFRSLKLANTWSLLMDPPYEKFIIYYRIVPGGIWVERVIHSSRDIPRRLLGEEPAEYAAVPAAAVTPQP